MSDDLITSLRALAAARHDDLSIAVDAVIEIERLRAENEKQRAEVEKLRAKNARLRAQVGEYFAEPETHPVEET